jgi:hypothetical protein
MRTNLKVILTVVSVAVLASPAMAQSESHAVPSAAHVSHAHGSAAHTHTGRPAAGAVTEGSLIHLDDCVHVAFPQCSDSQPYHP